MDKKKKVKEDRARRMAKRRGFTFVKNRRRDPLAVGYNTCWLEEDGIPVTKPSSLDSVLGFLGEADAVISGIDQAHAVTMMLLEAASATGWRVTPPHGGPCLTFADALPLIIREYYEAARATRHTLASI